MTVRRAVITVWALAAAALLVSFAVSRYNAAQPQGWISYVPLTSDEDVARPESDWTTFVRDTRLWIGAAGGLFVAGIVLAAPSVRRRAR